MTAARTCSASTGVMTQGESIEGASAAWQGSKSPYNWQTPLAGAAVVEQVHA